MAILDHRGNEIQVDKPKHQFGIFIIPPDAHIIGFEKLDGHEHRTELDDEIYREGARLRDRKLYDSDQSNSI